MKFGKSMRAFLKGMGSVLDIFPATPEVSMKVKERSEQSVKDALASDWQAIGGDFRTVGNDMRNATKKIMNDEGLKL